jgi:hypothetical protein
MSVAAGTTPMAASAPKRPSVGRRLKRVTIELVGRRGSTMVDRDRAHDTSTDLSLRLIAGDFNRLNLRQDSLSAHDSVTR